MTVKRRDFQKAAALVHEFLLKLSEDAECAELRDALNLALLHMQRYYRKLRSRLQSQDKQSSNGSSILSQSLRGLSPMTPFRDAPDKFQWKWINLENTKLTSTLPADLNKEFSSLPQIILAAKNGDNDMLMTHLERDPDCIFEVDGIGRNALMYAVCHGHLDTVQILLENSIEPNVTAHDGSTAVHRACHDGNHEVLTLLTGYEADLEIHDSQGRYPIHWACAHKNRECLQILLDNNADSTVRDNDGMTPSMWACRMDNIEHFELLSSLENISVSEEDGIERDSSGRTWMHWSVRRTEPLECLKTLLTEDSAIMKDEEGKTVIHIASEMGALAAAKVILEIGGHSTLEQRDSNNRTPLILAAIGGHGEIVNYLLSEGADLACVDSIGATAWDYACNRQLHYCMLILASYIRQRAREAQDDDDQGHSPVGHEGLINDPADTLKLNHLQINGDNPMLHSQRPIPPPHPPSQPPTPRTPRTARPQTPAAATPRGQYTPRGQQPGSQYMKTMKAKMVKQSITPRAPVTPRSSKEYSSGIKRSPSTPDANENDEFFSRNQQKPRSPGNKRLKNEHSPDRDNMMSVMSVDSFDNMTPPRIPSAGSARHHPSHSQDHIDAMENEPELASDSQYIEGADDDQSRVSIDAMDVSDFEPEAEEAGIEGGDEGGDGLDDGDGHYPNHIDYPHNNYNQRANPSPRPPPKPNQNQQTNLPYSYAPKSPPAASTHSHQGAPPKDAKRPGPSGGGNPNYYSQHARKPSGVQENYNEVSSPENADADYVDAPPQDGSRAQHVHFPSGEDKHGSKVQAVNSVIDKTATISMKDKRNSDKMKTQNNTKKTGNKLKSTMDSAFDFDADLSEGTKRLLLGEDNHSTSESEILPTKPSNHYTPAVSTQNLQSASNQVFPETKKSTKNSKKHNAKLSKNMTIENSRPVTDMGLLNTLRSASSNSLNSIKGVTGSTEPTKVDTEIKNGMSSKPPRPKSSGKKSLPSLDIKSISSAPNFSLKSDSFLKSPTEFSPPSPSQIFSPARSPETTGFLSAMTSRTPIPQSDNMNGRILQGSLRPLALSSPINGSNKGSLPSVSKASLQPIRPNSAPENKPRSEEIPKAASQPSPKACIEDSSYGDTKVCDSPKPLMPVNFGAEIPSANKSHSPSADSRIVPPAHLSPLPNPDVPQKRKKKKKKKDRPETMAPPTEGDFPQNRGYVAPIPPPLHQGQQPTPQARERSPPWGGPGGDNRERPNPYANLRPQSAVPGDKPMPKKRSSSVDSHHEQRPKGLLSNRIGYALDSQLKVTKPVPSPPPPINTSGMTAGSPSRVPMINQSSRGRSSDRSARDHPANYPNHHRGRPQDNYNQGHEGHRSRLTVQGQGHPVAGKRFQSPVQNGSLANNVQGQSEQQQNGPVHKRPPSGNRREQSPATREQPIASPRGKRPPSGSLGGSTQQGLPWTQKQLPNGRLPPSYN